MAPAHFDLDAGAHSENALKFKEAPVQQRALFTQNTIN